MKQRSIGLWQLMGFALTSLGGTLLHFMYEWFPNPLFSLIFPVNESIWEHMKLLVTPVLIFSLIEYILYKKKDINYNNFILSYSISTLIGIIIYFDLNILTINYFLFNFSFRKFIHYKFFFFRTHFSMNKTNTFLKNFL